MRDADVLGQRLGEAVDDLDEESDREAGRLLLDRLAAERASPTSPRSHEALDSDRYLRAHPGAGRPGASTPPLLDEADRAGRATRAPSWPAEPWEHLRKRVGRLDKHPTDEELHRVRILAKRARYAAEAASAVIPAAGRHAAAIAELQSVLGDHQDAVVAEAVAAGLDRGGRHGAGGLRRRPARRGTRSDAGPQAPPPVAAAWDEADRKKLTAWLTP